MDVPPSDLIDPALLPLDTPPTPGLDLNEDLGPRVVGVAAFLVVLSFVIVGLRFLARYKSAAGIWWDDWMCLAAMIVSWGTCFCCFLAPAYSFGKHEAALGGLLPALMDSEQFFKVLYAYETLYSIAVTLSKFSIVLFYLRIFTERPFRLAMYALSTVIGLWYVSVQIIQLVQCRPLSALWDGTYAENCIDILSFFIGAGVVNCVLNFILLVVPLPMIWGLAITPRAKVGLTATFLLGIFVFAVSVARLVFLHRVQNIDVTFSYVDAAIWTTVEPNIAVCSASLPILRSLYILLRPGSQSSSSVQRSTRKGGSIGPGGTARSTNRSAREKGGAVAWSNPISVTSPIDALDESPEVAKLNRMFSVRTTSTGRGGKDEGVSPITPGYGMYATLHSPAETSSPLSELSAHRSLPYGGGGYESYAVNISSDNNKKANRPRSISKKSSIASRLGSKSPRFAGGRSPSLSSRSIEMASLPIQGALESEKIPVSSPNSPKMQAEGEDVGARGFRMARESGSLTGRTPVAELYA